MSVVKGELSLGGSGVQQILFQLNHRPKTIASFFREEPRLLPREVGGGENKVGKVKG